MTSMRTLTRTLALARRDYSVAVVIPARDEERTIGPICEALETARRCGVCDRVIVADQSTDATASRAKAAGARVVDAARIRPELGPVLGKGDAMWRALQVVDEDVVVFLDGDTRRFDARVVEQLLAPIGQGARFVKADYARPWDDGRGPTLPTGGGRVTELTAKPLLRALFPTLGCFGQPLAGELAAHTALLRELPFVTGYGVDVALLIDAFRAVGADGLAEVRVTPRQNRHRPLVELAPMAHAVSSAILARAGITALEHVERRPLAELDARAERVPA